MKAKFFYRKTHRYLGLLTAIQFLFWTISGLYFSWTNIDDIHGDPLKINPTKYTFGKLISPSDIGFGVLSVEMRNIGKEPYYWLNDSILVHAQTGIVKSGISDKEAIIVAYQHLNSTLQVKNIRLLEQVDNHHEYRERRLPTYAIEFEHPDKVIAYISKQDGKFQTVRHKRWRWFDWLWMTHTMDYQSRDNINNWLLRVFSVLGVITVVSGIALWIVSLKLGRKHKS